MINPELVREFLMALEAEHGCPVQLRADAEGTLGKAHGMQYLGRFEDRPVLVQRVNDLVPKYERDASLIEGVHPNLAKLLQTIEEYNVLFNPPIPNTIAQRAFKLIEGLTGERIAAGTIASALDTPPISPDYVYKLLEQNAIPYFVRNVVVEGDRVYLFKDYNGEILQPRIQIADISLKLVDNSTPL